MRSALVILAILAAPAARADVIRCDNIETSELSIDGLLDDWKPNKVVARIGAPADGAIDLRCSWDGTALALMLDIKDDRVVRVRSGKGHEDHVDIKVAAGGKPLAITVFPGNALAKSKIAAPPKIEVADSLQPKGFSIEARIPAARLAGFSPSTPSLELDIVFHDADLAAGGHDNDLVLASTIELGDRKDLLEDFLRAVHLRRSDLKLDTLAELDPDHRGKQRIVAGGTIIGVLADQFAYVTLPAAAATDVREVKLLPLGARGLAVVSAVIRQSGNGGSRDLLMLWTVASGQLQPLVQIEVRKELHGNVLESTWRVATWKQRPELVVEPKPAVGWTAETWNEQPADDADPILLPWDRARGGIGYALRGHVLERRDLPTRERR